MVTGSVESTAKNDCAGESQQPKTETKDINYEDGHCNVCQNFGKPLIFSSAYSQIQ
jgi:hypothetical protein